MKLLRMVVGVVLVYYATEAVAAVATAASQNVVIFALGVPIAFGLVKVTHLEHMAKEFFEFVFGP